MTDSLFNKNKYPDHAFLKKQPTMMTSSDEALSDLLQVTKQMTLQPVWLQQLNCT